MKTPDLIAIANFWSWLSDRRADLERLHHPDEPFWDEILGQLAQIHEGIWIEISQDMDPRELVFTAHGDAEVFPSIDALVEDAPNWDGWWFRALKPVSGIIVSTRGDGIDLSPRGFWIMPLRSKKNPSFFGVRVAIPEFNDNQVEDPFINAAWRVIDGLLGERKSAEGINHLEICSLPESPEQLGYAPIERLPEAFERHQARVADNNRGTTSRDS